MINYKETQQILNKYKIPFVQSKLIKSKEEAFSFAEKQGYPVVLKSASPQILHRTELGAVIAEIEDKEKLSEAYENLLEIEKVKEGEILVQKQISGREIMVGAKIDSTFGPIVLFGLGGIFVEVYKDISFRLAPIEREEAEKMIEEIKGAEILKDFRGKKSIDIVKLKDILVQTSKLIAGEEIEELDFNPVIANPKGTWVVDAKIVRTNC